MITNRTILDGILKELGFRFIPSYCRRTITSFQLYSEPWYDYNNDDRWYAESYEARIWINRNTYKAEITGTNFLITEKHEDEYHKTKFDLHDPNFWNNFHEWINSRGTGKYDDSLHSQSNQSSHDKSYPNLEEALTPRESHQNEYT